MIVVERGAFFEAEIVAIAVIAIVLEHNDLLRTQAVDDAPDDRRFAGAGAAGDTYDNRFDRAMTGVARTHEVTSFFTVFHQPVVDAGRQTWGELNRRQEQRVR